MSNKVMNKVWALSRSKGTERLVLVALADYANEAGEAYPSTNTLARKVNCSKRSTQYALANLVQMGELLVDRNAGDRGCNKYRFNLPPGVQHIAPPIDPEGVQHVAPPDDLKGVQPVAPLNGPGGVQPASWGGEAGFAKGVQPAAPEPSLNHQEPLEEIVSDKTATKAKGRKAKAVSLATYLESCEERGVLPIPEDAPVWSLADRKRIPFDLIDLAWEEFKRRRLPGGAYEAKEQADWPATFRNAVDGNWDKLWWCRPDGTYELSSHGHEAVNLHRRQVA